MDSIKFLNKIVMKFDEVCLSNIKEALNNKYITFTFIKGDVTKEVFIEKLNDYLVQIMLKNNGSFDDLIKSYTNDMKSLVKSKLTGDSRASKYYDLANAKIDYKSLNTDEIVDFSRIILCMYNAIIKNKHKDINNFDLSLNNIKLSTILDSMDKEKTAQVDLGVVDFGSKLKFDTRDKYSSDAFTYVMVIIMYYHLMNNEVKGEY